MYNKKFIGKLTASEMPLLYYFFGFKSMLDDRKHSIGLEPQSHPSYTAAQGPRQSVHPPFRGGMKRN